MPAPWRAFLVVRNELPRERATLILRATGTGRVLTEATEDVLHEPADSRIRAILVRHLAGLHLELLDHPRDRTPEEEEFAMTGQEMLREVETKARKEGLEDGRKAGLEDGRKAGLEDGRKAGREDGRKAGREMVRLAFEQRFGPIPSSLDEALGHIQDLGELERIMAACLSKPKDEIARILGVGVH
jgi:flagellar biosynthesis/type III secretory pathway protein FliH